MKNAITIPKDRTFKELLFNASNAPSHSNEFIEINKQGMVEIGAMDASEYELFWDCMKIYEVSGINYFPLYVDLCKGSYGDFSQGIEAWFNHPAIGFTPDVEKFLELVDVMRFFNISSYYGIDYPEYKKAAQQAHKLYQAAMDNEAKQRKEKDEETTRKRIDSYFNFYDFSEKKFNELSRSLIKGQEQTLSINEALALAHFAPQNTYIVILKKGNRVFHIGKTEHLLSYIGTYQKKSDVDSAYFEIVDAEYVDDLIISMKVLYDIELDKIRTSRLNRKYATIKQATFAYKQLEGFSKKIITSAIQKHKLRTTSLENGQILIDKVALHRALSNGKYLW